MIQYGRIYNNSIEVHHIEPIVQDYELRLDEGNLISLCTYHHKMADRGEIPREILKSIVNEKGIGFSYYNNLILY
jgi:predicted restriction endonuclease